MIPTTKVRLEFSTEALKASGFVDKYDPDLTALDELLNEKGDEGWDLAQLLPGQNLKREGPAHVLIFRRPIEE